SVFVGLTDSAWGFFASTAPSTTERASNEGIELYADGPLRPGLHAEPMGSPSARLLGCNTEYRARELGDRGAYAIELTSVHVGRCTRGPDGKPRRGTVSGRVIAMFQGGDTQSWVAGSFTDVPVVSEGCE